MAPLWVVPGLIVWLAVLLLPWRPWSTRERLEAVAGDAAADLHDVVALVPARNEAAVLPGTLRALSAQGSGLGIVLVDDQSTDGTAHAAQDAGIPGLRLVRGAPVPPGWSGKVWALEQGRGQLDRPLALLLDADIELAPGAVAALRARLRENGGGMVSLMAELPARGAWERLLIPAFIFFFKLLYPFGCANSPRSRVAAAAGGCILIETRILDELGGFGSLRDALIDDCTLARLVKRKGYSCWIGLTRSVRSARAYVGPGDVWRMVARTAFTQLRYSRGLLLVCTLVMAFAFVAPPVALALGQGPARLAAGAALLCMACAYLPTLRFYDIPGAWVLGLPVAGTLYLGMTWHSAIGYWRGTRSQWKDRRYPRGDNVNADGAG